MKRFYSKYQYLFFNNKSKFAYKNLPRLDDTSQYISDSFIIETFENIISEVSIPNERGIIRWGSTVFFSRRLERFWNWLVILFRIHHTDSFSLRTIGCEKRYWPVFISIVNFTGENIPRIFTSNYALHFVIPLISLQIDKNDEELA